MRKFLAMLLIIVLCSGAFGSNIKIPPKSGGGEVKSLTPQQKQELQLDADILAHCVLTNAAPFIVFGFSSEVAIFFGMKECTPEGENLEMTMYKVGLTEEEASANFDNLFKGLLQFADKSRNEEALKRMKEYQEKKKGEVTL